MTARRNDLFAAHPATGHEDLVVRYPETHNGHLAHCFAEAAERIASTFTGRAPDDAVLLPFLYLYRHAIELTLKHYILDAARLRVAGGDEDPALLPATVVQRLKTKHGHRLMALLEELDRHLAALRLEPVPAQTRRTLERLAATDRTGESFRYVGSLPAEQDHINFRTLHADVRGAYDVLGGVSGVLDQIEDALEEHRAVVDEYEAELRREMDAEYGGES